jgi:hypothetical protein
VNGQLYAPAAIPPEERFPDTHWTEGWVGPRASMDVVEGRKIKIPDSVWNGKKNNKASLKLKNNIVI